MQVEIHWENAAKSVLRVTCVGTWNWVDMRDTLLRWRAGDLAYTDNYCMIIDLRGITSIASDAVLHLKEGAQYARDLNGLIIVVMSSTAAAILFKMFVSMYRGVSSKFRSVASDQEAYSLLGLSAEQPAHPA